MILNEENEMQRSPLTTTSMWIVRPKDIYTDMSAPIQIVDFLAFVRLGPSG